MRPCIGAAPDTVQRVAPVGRLKFDHQKKTNSSESNAPFPLKLITLRAHVYEDLEFLDSSHARIARSPQQFRRRR